MCYLSILTFFQVSRQECLRRNDKTLPGEIAWREEAHAPLTVKVYLRNEGTVHLGFFHHIIVKLWTYNPILTIPSFLRHTVFLHINTVKLCYLRSWWGWGCSWGSCGRPASRRSGQWTLCSQHTFTWDSSNVPISHRQGSDQYCTAEDDHFLIRARYIYGPVMTP